MHRKTSMQQRIKASCTRILRRWLKRRKVVETLRQLLVSWTKSKNKSIKEAQHKTNQFPHNSQIYPHNHNHKVILILLVFILRLRLSATMFSSKISNSSNSKFPSKWCVRQPNSWQMRRYQKQYIARAAMKSWSRRLWRIISVAAVAVVTTCSSSQNQHPDLIPQSKCKSTCATCAKRSLSTSHSLATI